MKRGRIGMENDIDKMQVDLHVLLGKGLEGGGKGGTEGYEGIGSREGIVLDDFIHNGCKERNGHKRKGCKLRVTLGCQHDSTHRFYDVDCILYGKRELLDGLNPLNHFPLRRELLTDRVRILCNLITYTQSYGHAGKE